MTRPWFAGIPDGFQSFEPREICLRHRHEVAYAAVVLAGSYVEAGDRGRHNMSPGDVLIHDVFEAHCDNFAGGRSAILNLRLPSSVRLPFARGRVRDPDRIVRVAERDHDAALSVLLEELEPVEDRQLCDWPDILAHDLSARASLQISSWAAEHGLTREAVSRGFRRLYGVAPARFRAEAHARKAWRMLTKSSLALSTVAAQCGFADQAHMTRVVHGVTGQPPGAWRRSHRFKTATGA